GMYVVRGRLDSEAGALPEKALESAGEALFRRLRAEPRQVSGANALNDATPAAQQPADSLNGPRPAAQQRAMHWDSLRSVC
ncbi:MAG: hypothetical protein ACRELT_03335, partial [Longimicrobiales bacterium]